MKLKVLIALFAAFLLPASVVAAGTGDAKAGHQIYAAHCQMCHGAKGEGNANLAKMLHATIPNLGSKAVQSLSDAQMREVIEKGKAKMPPVHGLTAAEVDDVIAFVRTLAKK
jgi:mono/diheme cytochrome c family protein